MPVRSHKNRQLVEAARLHRARERRDRGQTLIEGPHVLEEALAGGVTPVSLFALEDDEPTRELAASRHIDLLLVDDMGLARVAGTKSPRGPVALIEIPGGGSLGDGPGVLVSWGVGDPGNVGTMIRLAAAFGWVFAYTEGTADPWAPKVLRAGAGAQFRSRPIPISGLEDLTGAGYTPVATVVEGGDPPDRLGPGRYAVLVGEEAAGLPADVADQAATKVTILMPGGTESLNAAVAAAIVMYELSKNRVPGAKHGEQ
jgi:TrmH family RNA methyltransferase